MWNSMVNEHIFNPPNGYKFIKHRSQKKKRIISR